MSRIIFIIAALIGLVVMLLVIAPGLIPASTYKDRIEASASEALGREVTMGDDLSFRIFPRTAFRVADLEIANADGFEGDYLARVERADIGVKLFALLSGIVEVDRFVLTGPDIALVSAADGRVNWNLAGDSAGDASGGGASSGGASGGELRELRLGDVRIVNGRARFTDAASQTTYAAENINVAVVLKSLAEPLEAKGDLTFQGAPATVDLVFTTLADFMNNEPANLKLDAILGDTSAGADMTIASGEVLSYAGPVRLDAPDLAALAALVGAELADAPGFDRFSVSGDVEGGETALRLSNAAIGFDDIAAQGALGLDWSGARPRATGVLSTERLDLRPYMPPPAESPEGFPAWSEAPMDFASLRNIDADLDISTDAIFVNDLQMGESRLLLKVDDGRMTADIPELSMYGGQGSGQFVVNARGATPSFSGNFDMGAVEAQPLSLDLLKHDNLLGLGSFNFNFTASGASQAAIMASMNGAGGFDLADGALKGVNFAGLARAAGALQGGINPAALAQAVTAARGPAEQTDFSEFLSNFTIADGQVTAPTISLTGPFVTMSGRGGVDLPGQTIDLRLTPRASASASGEGGRAVAVPVRIGGTFSAPTISIDAEAFLQGGAEETLRGVLQGIGGRNDDAAEAAGEDGDGEEPSLEDALINEGLNALFGRRDRPAEDDDGGGR